MHFGSVYPSSLPLLTFVFLNFVREPFLCATSLAPVSQEVPKVNTEVREYKIPSWDLLVQRKRNIELLRGIAQKRKYQSEQKSSIDSPSV